jgi:subtilisin family serine protease
MGAATWKILGTGGAVIAGVAAKKVLNTGWKAATGNPPPANPEHPDTSWGEALAWAVFSGAVIGVARMLMARKTASYYRKSTGHLPAKLQDVG